MTTGNTFTYARSGISGVITNIGTHFVTVQWPNGDKQRIALSTVNGLIGLGWAIITA